MADTEAELRKQFTNTFQNADYPIANQMELMPVLPNGPSTKFTAGDVSLTAMELATRASGHQNFPYANADDLVDDLMAGLRDENVF